MSYTIHQAQISYITYGEDDEKAWEEVRNRIQEILDEEYPCLQGYVV